MKQLIRLGIVTILVSVVVFSAFPARAVRAQDVDATRRIVQQWVLDTLDKPYLILVEYTYSSGVWDDSSLGCPTEGQTPISGSYSGYRWTFTFDNFVRYEVHSGVFGDPVVLCSATNIAANVPMSVYTAPAFDVLIPESWLIFANNAQTDVSFGPGTSIPCEQTGMRVLVIGAVEPGTTAVALVDEFIADKTTIEDARQRVGTFGYSDVFNLACGEKTSLERVTMIVESGFAYQIEQWSPEDEFPEWDSLFLDILTQFNTNHAALVTPTPDVPDPTATNTPAPTTTGVPLDGAPATNGAAATPAPDATGTLDGTAVAAAEPVEPGVLPALPVAHIFLGDLFLGTLDELPGRSVTLTPEDDRRYLHFAPDGQKLVFTDATNAAIRVMDAQNGLSARKVASDVMVDFPPAWSPDSRDLAYVVDTGERDGDAALLAVYRVSAAGGDAALIGGFTYRDGCELTSSDPADAVYVKESGTSADRTALVWLSGERLLVSTGCAGGLGVLMPAEQQIIELGEDLHGGVLSPDRQHLLSLTDSGLAVLDFAEWQRRDISLGTAPQQIAWGLDGQSVYYATATQTDTLTLDDADQAERGEAFFGLWPVTIRVYALTIIQLDLRNDQPTVIWQGRGRGIGSMHPVPDGSGLVFTLVPSSLPMAEVFNGGGDAMALNEARPASVMYWLATGSPTAQLLAYSGQPAFGDPALFTSEATE